MLMSWGKLQAYEYVGFIYLIKDGKLKAAPDQHSAAYKEKHRMNAQRMYDEETV